MPLGTRERAFAVASVRALGSRAEAMCARRSSALRQFAAGLVRDARVLDEEAARLGRAVPDGVEEIHASWYDAPPASSNPRAEAWLERRAYAHLVGMLRPTGEPSHVADALERRSGTQLSSLVVALGRRRVATAFAGAPRGALAQLCARLGEPSGSELVTEVRQLAARVVPAQVTAAQQALHRGGALVEGALDGTQLFLRVGLAWLAPALAERGGDRLERVAQRLPRAIGESLLAHAHAEPPDLNVFETVAALLAQLRPRAV